MWPCRNLVSIVPRPFQHLVLVVALVFYSCITHHHRCSTLDLHKLAHSSLDWKSHMAQSGSLLSISRLKSKCRKSWAPLWKLGQNPLSSSVKLLVELFLKVKVSVSSLAVTQDLSALQGWPAFHLMWTPLSSSARDTINPFSALNLSDFCSSQKI